MRTVNTVVVRNLRNTVANNPIIFIIFTNGLVNKTSRILSYNFTRHLSLSIVIERNDT